MVDKIANPLQAAGAYLQGAKAAAKPALGEAGPSFADFLRDKTASAVETLKAGEKMQAKAVAGTADLPDVVRAVTSAELTLQTIVALRDRLIGAYQEIMRTAI